jgi:hypothetical protein
MLPNPKWLPHAANKISLFVLYVGNFSWFKKKFENYLKEL